MTQENLTMHPTVERLNDLMDWVGSTAKATEGFVIEQAPLVAQEIVAWEFWGCIGHASLFLAFAIAGTLTIRLLWRKDKDGNLLVDDEAARFVPSILGGIACVAFVVAAADYGIHAIKAKVAPRIVIIDYVAGKVGKP